MKFADKHSYKGGYCYGVINEQLGGWREALKDVAGFGAKRGAAICSGGEVGFFLLLPHVQEELTMLDYSYGSLFYALGKYHVIEKKGASFAHDAFTKYPEYTAEYAKALEAYRYGVYNYTTHRYDHPPKPTPPAGDLLDLFFEGNKGIGKQEAESAAANWPLVGLDRVWADLSVEEVAAFRKNRTKVNFVHGDISQLAETGPYDFVYFSNALQYHSAQDGDPYRHSYALDYNQEAAQYEMDKIIKPGGYALYCYQGAKRAEKDSRRPGGGYYSGRHSTPQARCVAEWESVACITPTELAKRDVKRNYGMGWTYEISKAPA